MAGAAPMVPAASSAARTAADVRRVRAANMGDPPGSVSRLPRAEASRSGLPTEASGSRAGQGRLNGSGGGHRGRTAGFFTEADPGRRKSVRSGGEDSSDD